MTTHTAVARQAVDGLASPRRIVRGRSPNSVNPIARPVVPSCWRAWLHLASLVQERGDLPGYPLEFLDLAVRSEEQRLNSSHGYISYAVFCLKKKKKNKERSKHERKKKNKQQRHKNLNRQ